MDPDMMKFASDMMSKMTPEQIAAMQRQAASMDPAMMQQAMNMMNNMTPEQRRAMQQQAAAMSPDTFVDQATKAEAQLSAQQKYQFDASTNLKADGNRLHGLKRFQEAAEKYKNAAENLSLHSAPQSVALRTSCRSNLASCYLQLGQWNECVAECNEVLKVESANRKAFYRRGQAYAALNRLEEALRDLQRALELSPDSEKPVIKEKLEEVEQKQSQARQGVVIEEIIDNDAEDIESKANEEEPKKEQEQKDTMDGVIEEVTDAGIEGETLDQTPGGTVGGAHEDSIDGSHPPSSSSFPFPQPGAPLDPTIAADHLRRDPNALKNAARMMDNMTPDQINAMAAGMPGMPPGMKIDAEQLKMAAKMMETMSPEDLENMTKLAQSMNPNMVMGMQPNAAQGGAPLTPPLPTSTSATVPGAAPHFDPGSMPMPPMMNDMRRKMADPEMLKSMQGMLKGMDPEILASMMKSSGMNMTPEQAKKMIESMGNVNESQLVWIARLTGIVNYMIDTYQKIKSFAMANTAVTVAIILLVVFFFLRWLGWV